MTERLSQGETAPQSRSAAVDAFASKDHRDPYCPKQCRPGSRHSQCGCNCNHRRPLILDLFCGAFGAGEGYRRAGFDVVGIDLVERPRPAEERISFVQGDALEALDMLIDGGSLRVPNAPWQNGYTLRDFAAVHASPPCHDWSDLKARSGLDGTGDLLPATLDLLRRVQQPWVVENVTGARTAMPGSLVLCGSEFDLGATDREGRYRVLKRHRLFLSNRHLWGAGGCHCTGRLIGGVYGNGGGGQQQNGYKFHVAEAREAMGMPWADRVGVSLAIPPAYTQFIGEQLLHLIAQEAA